MKNLIKLFSIIGLVSMSHVAFAIDNVADGDVLSADTLNEIIDATNENTAKINLDFDITMPCTAYSVGDTGPQGGLVFYVTSDGCDGLEAWTADEADSNWGCLITEVGAIGTAIGTGAPNTQLIDSAACSAGGAAAITRDAVHGTSDWYLPSIAELKTMYDAIGPGGGNAGGFDATGVYWSSSEIDNENVAVVNFANGTEISNPKNFNRNTRAIRTFNP